MMEKNKGHSGGKRELNREVLRKVQGEVFEEH